jgi:glycosyltransferase involved in cell wall biosynthesis
MSNKRIRLGIIFNFNASWMGGIIYILNLIKTINFLNEEDKPEIFLFYRPDLEKFVNQITYPYFKAVSWEFPSVYQGYLYSWMSRKNVFINEITEKYELNGLYPLHDFPVKTRSATKLVCWYADLQHMYYPEFFSRKKLLERSSRIRFILRNAEDLVVSSQAVADDFRKFFRLRDGMRIHIFHFVSVIEGLEGLDLKDLLLKYDLPQRYFIVSNQFHKHKNHKVLLKAMVRLKQDGYNMHLAMTGRFPDATHSPYMEELHRIIDEHKLHKNIGFMGIIPRNEQLMLMKHSQAVLQPSLFEGWSTVIEDAISLQVPVIASSLPVNIEQLGPDGKYFEPNDHIQLADLIRNLPARNLNDVFYTDYKVRIRNAAETFLDIFRS